MSSSEELYKNPMGQDTQYYLYLRYKFIDLIQALPQSMPTAFEPLQLIFENKFYIKEQNDYYAFLETGSFRTLDGVAITNVNIGIPKKEPLLVSSININLDKKQCVNPKYLQEQFGFSVFRYGGSQLNDPNMVVNCDAIFDWGVFGISFLLHQRDCTTAIGKHIFIDEKQKEMMFKLQKDQEQYPWKLL